MLLAGEMPRIHRVLKPGDYVGGYQVVQELGKGGMARVYRARRMTLGKARKAVALKVMLEHVSQNPTYRQMFLREVKIAMLLNSPNVVQVFEAGEDPNTGLLYMAMQWIQGHNLAKIRDMMTQRGERLPLEISAYIVGEILAALDHAHGMYSEGNATGIIHRDVKPQNVLIGHDGTVLLADFGVARTVYDDSSMAPKGTLRYMPREQLLSKVTQQSDLFGAGAIFYELLSGERFRGHATDDAKLYNAILGNDKWRKDGLSMPAPDGGQGTVPIPEELERLLEGLVAPEEDDRFASASAALETLERWSGYRPGRRALAKLYGQLWGEAATRTVSGHTSYVTVDFDDPEVQRRRAALGLPPVETRTQPMLEAAPPPRITKTVPLTEPAAAPTHTAVVSHAQPPHVVSTPPVAPTDTGLVFLGLRSPWSWLVAIAIVLGGGITLGTVAVSILRSLQHEAAQPTETSAQVVDAPDASASAPSQPTPMARADRSADEASPEPPVQPPTDPDPAAPVEASQGSREAPPPNAAVESPKSTSASSSTRPRAKPKPKPKPAEPKETPLHIVHLRLQDIPERAAHVKIGKIEYVVEPLRTIRLSPGRYSITWRKSKAERWQPAKTFKFGTEDDEWLVFVGPKGVAVHPAREYLKQFK